MIHFETDKNLYKSLTPQNIFDYNTPNTSTSRVYPSILLALSFDEGVDTLKDQRSHLEKIFKAKKLLSKTYTGINDIWIFTVNTRHYVIYNNLDRGTTIEAGGSYSDADTTSDLKELIKHIKPQLSKEGLYAIKHYKPF